LIAAFNFLGLFFSFAVLATIVIGWRKGFRVIDLVILLTLILFNAITSLSNFLEWSGITGALDLYEDYLDVLLVAFWGFFLVSLIEYQYENALKESEAKYQHLVESANSIILRMSPTGRVNFLNRFALDFFGYTKNETIGRHVVGTIVPETESSGRDLGRMIEDICRDAEQFRLNENENVTKDGKKVWISWTNRPIFDEEGRLAEILCIGNDITRIKNAERFLKDSLQEKKILLKEIHHRVKNNLQVVSGLMNLQSMFVKDPKAKEIFKESENRIVSMSLIHEYLHRSTALAKVSCRAYIQDLTDSLYRSYNIHGKKIGLEVDIEDFELSLDTSVPCGLIINELVTNALIHAFPENKSGLVTVTFRLREDGRCSLTVRDNGIGMSEAELEKKRSLGLKLVWLLAEQLNADLDFSGKGGTSISLTFSEYHEAGPALF